MEQPVDTDTIRHYCLTHELKRPAVHLGRAAILCISVVALSMVASVVLCHLADIGFWTWFDICINVSVLCMAKPLMVFLIHCYQHYAPEKIRRQCSCMPSCSEYALLALDKYPWPIAFWKIWRRVNYTCSKPGYHIDYP